MKTNDIDSKEEFRRLLQASGWSQAEAARQLGMTPSALSQIVRSNSKVQPSAISMRLFKLLVWREKPEALQVVAEREEMPGLERPERELIRKLRGLTARGRWKLLRTFAQLIANVPKAEKLPPKTKKKKKNHRR